MSPATASPQTSMRLRDRKALHSEHSTFETSVNLQVAQQCASETITAQIRQALLEFGYQALQRIGVHVDGEAVRLTGEVRSYHLKQLATSAVLSIDGVEQLENDLKVCR